MEFTAIPDDGYQVKEWKFNGEVVEGNKINSFTTPTVVNIYVTTITVEFEPMPQN